MPEPGIQGSSPTADLEADAAIRDWPENVEPTPQQLSTWLYSCGERRRIAFCERVLRETRIASDCFVRNHDRELAALRAEVQSMRLTVLAAVRDIGDEVTPEQAVAARLVKADLDRRDSPILQAEQAMLRQTLPVPIDT